MNATTNYTGLGPMHAVLDAFTRDAHTPAHPRTRTCTHKHACSSFVCSSVS